MRLADRRHEAAGVGFEFEGVDAPAGHCEHGWRAKMKAFHVGVHRAAAGAHQEHVTEFVVRVGANMPVAGPTAFLERFDVGEAIADRPRRFAEQKKGGNGVAGAHTRSGLMIPCS